MRNTLAALILLALPGAALAQTPAPGSGPTPGPTASPATGDPTSHTSNGTANITQPDHQGAPLGPATPAPPVSPSGAPPDVVVVPK